MKKIVTLVSLGLLLSVCTKAQTIYDAANLSGKDLNGTARFVGMGGAMGALGGDISTMGTNPAGIGIFRSHDFVTSFGFSNYSTNSKYEGRSFDSNNFRGSFDNLGFVISTKIGNKSALRYVNFGFNYQKAKSFYRNMETGGGLGNLSQTQYMAKMSEGIMWGNDPLNDLNNSDLGWLSILGYQGWVITDVTTTPTNTKYLDDKGNWLHTPGGTPLYITPGEYRGEGINRNGVSSFGSQERGGIDQYDFNVSFNFNDRFYLGMTVGAYSVNYTKYYFYSEDYKNVEGYTLQSWNKIQGSGIDVKMGAIIRPFESSPFRIGLAIHTPTFYSLDYKTNALIESDILDLVDGKINKYGFDTQQTLGGDMIRPFRLQTPWVYNVSLGHTIGNSFALGAEYEYKDYSTNKFNHSDGESMTFENSTTSMMRGVHTLRFGAEYKVIPQFALRAGYNYSSTAFSKNAWKKLSQNSMQTDTDFANAKAKSDYTLGIGYRGSVFYADLAYKYTTFKSDFFSFVNIDGSWKDGNVVLPNSTSVTNSRSQVLMTLGIRF